MTIFPIPSLKMQLGLAGLMLLSACGGNGGSGATASYIELEDELISLEARIVDQTGTLAENLPTGAATYDGFLTGDLIIAGRRDLGVIGEATIEADFDSNTVTGSVDNFVGQDITGAEQALDGSLAIGDGRISSGGDGMTVVTADAVGDLTDSEGRAASLDLDLVGFVQGEDGQFIRGEASGSVTADDGAGTDVEASFTSSTFILENTAD